MNRRAVAAIVRKDLTVVLRSKAILIPMIVVPLVMLLILPLTMAFIPNLAMAPGAPMSGMDEFMAQMPAALRQSLAGLDEAQMIIVLMLVHFMAPLYLILPLMVSSVVAADSFAGEKERKTLEALLYTPTTDRELYLGKLLSAWLPAMGVALGGFVVYTVVANVLWPVKAVDNTRQLAARVCQAYARAFGLLAYPVAVGPTNNDEQLAALLASEEAFQVHFNQVKGTADQVAAYRAEWDAVLAGYEQLQVTLLPALRMQMQQRIPFENYLEDYPALVRHVESLFQQLEAYWRGDASQRDFEALPVNYRTGSLRDAPHLTVAAVTSRAELLTRLQLILLELHGALDSLLFDRGGFAAGRMPRGKPAFVWRNLEGIKTATRMFMTFWLAAGVWIFSNPPGGFTFVTLCSVLVLLVSYTPVTPKLLFILFSMGFLCALPAYIFLLPGLTHWLQLAAFMFAYAFAGFFLFQGPVSLFFLFGLFALGIQNTMSYNVDLILLIMLSFYLMFTLLIVTVHFPFTSKPERLYAQLSRRFFRNCGRMLELAGDFSERPRRLPADDGSALLAKLHSWGERIDTRYFSACQGRQLARFNQACDLLQGQLQVLLMRRREFAGNRLISNHLRDGQAGLLVQLCETLARRPGREADDAFELVEEHLAGLRDMLDGLRRLPAPQQVQRTELAQYFVYLNLQASVLACLHTCREARAALPWAQLAGSRF